MDYKENDIWDRIHKMYDDMDEAGKSKVERVFPELKESEDEMMIKFIKKQLFNIKKTITENYELDAKLTKAIAWLEKQGEQKTKKVSLWKHWKNGIAGNGEGKLIYLVKVGNTYRLTSCLEFECDYIELSELDNLMLKKQGEQKPADKVEPKFKVEKDKWYVCISQYCNCIEGRNYKASLDGRIIDDYGTEYDMHNDAYRWFRPWTIKDAKDGDVLSYRDGQWIFIYKEKIDDSSFYYHTLYSTIHQDLTINDSAFTLLGDAIIPATKKQRDLLFQKMKEAGYKWDAEKKELEKVEQKPAWSEEDKEIIDNIIDYMTPMPIFFESTKGESGKEYTQEFIIEATNWLKSLKDRVQPQSKQEWSDKDKTIAFTLMRDVEQMSYISIEGKNERIGWLNKLPDNIRPQSQWKPTKEQINVLNAISNKDTLSEYERGMLCGLYTELKKLTEE